jgi:hypothetical protein
MQNPPRPLKVRFLLQEGRLGVADYGPHGTTELERVKGVLVNNRTSALR